MKKFYFVILVTGVFYSILLLSQTAAISRPFIRVVGTQFMEGERPFYFIGANLNVMHEPTARQQAPATISAAAFDGLRVGRIWALGEGLEDSPQWQRESFLFRSGPKGWHEAAFHQLDRVIAEAGKQGLRLIITLSNSWADYGGIPMYLRWVGQVDVESYGYTDRFFTDPQCKQWFIEHLKRIVGRTNKITGIPYRDDPTIMAWEFQNEMHGTPEGAVARRRWVREMARLIRQIDSNHLIVPGTLGYNLQSERREWISMNQLPEISYCDQHIYPEEHLRSQGLKNLQRFIDDRVQLAHYVIRKPIIFGEFGFADKGSPAKRSRWHKLFLERIFFDGGNGALVWIYQPKLSWSRTFGILIDRERYRSLRTTLGDMARQISQEIIANHNPLLNELTGEKPLAPTHALQVKRIQPNRKWIKAKDLVKTWVIHLPVENFYRAWFEEAGSWDGGVLVHAYGRQTGWFEYLFTGVGFIPNRLVVRARLSSEYPGSTAPPNGYSQVKVLLDSQLVGELRVQPDDGLGAWYSVDVKQTPWLRRLQRGNHRLRFQVDPGFEANGVAVYGRENPLNREPVDEVGPIQIYAYQ